MTAVVYFMGVFPLPFELVQHWAFLEFVAQHDVRIIMRLLRSTQNIITEKLVWSDVADTCGCDVTFTLLGFFSGPGNSCTSTLIEWLSVKAVLQASCGLEFMSPVHSHVPCVKVIQYQGLSWIKWWFNVFFHLLFQVSPWHRRNNAFCVYALRMQIYGAKKVF